MTALVVEFCGLPGSGKTTVAVHARNAMVGQGLACDVADAGISASAARPRRVALRLRSSLRESTRHPLSALGAASRIALSGQESPRDAVAVLAQWLTVRDLVEGAKRSGGLHLLEEGMLQTLWTLLLRSHTDPSRRLWPSLAGSRSDLIVMVDTPVALVQDRLEARESRHSRTQRLPAGLLRAELDRGRELLEQLVSITPVPVERLPVDGTATAAELGAQVASLVLRRTTSAACD
jgi:RecA/RadA recombinase